MNYDVEERTDAAKDLAPISQGGAGQLVTITRGTAGTYNTGTGSSTGSTPTVEYGSGISEAYKAHEIDGSIIKAGDLKFFMAALQFNADETVMSPEQPLTEPAAGFKVTLQGKDWRVMANEPLALAGLAMTHTLHLRG